MKLQLDTRINMIMFKKSHSNTIVMSCDLNMKFSDYLDLPMTPKSLSEMLNHDFKPMSSTDSFDSLGNKITLNSYSHVSPKLTTGFVEIIFLN